MAVDFTAPDAGVEKCVFTLKLPNFSFGFKLPSLTIDLTALFPTFGFTLSCDPANPIDVVGSLPSGGGRIAKFDLDPDNEDL